MEGTSNSSWRMDTNHIRKASIEEQKNFYAEEKILEHEN